MSYTWRMCHGTLTFLHLRKRDNDFFGVFNYEAHGGGGGGGAHVKILTGMLVLFFGFEIWPNPIFLGWQIF